MQARYSSRQLGSQYNSAKKFFSTDGIDNELNAIREYVACQQSHGHPLLTVSASSFLISYQHPYLGASPDGAVYDPLILSSRSVLLR